jgi:TonB family protein
MYFDFEDNRPDIYPVGRAISWREGVLLSIIVHLVATIAVLLAPKYLGIDARAARARAEAVEARQQQRESPRFVFVQPRDDQRAKRPPRRADASDMDREARTPQRAKKPENSLPYSRGNSPERVEQNQAEVARGQGPQPDPAAGQQARVEPQEPAQPDSAQLPESSSALQLPQNRPSAAVQNGAGGRAPVSGGALGDALRNLRKYTETYQFDNPQGGGSQFGNLQFDTKGVEFGPWVRRFVAQVRSNWLIPFAAMSMKGHVVITFNVWKDGRITDLTVVAPSSVAAFNNAAFGALVSSNPTAALPPEYPDQKAFFTVTFYYNEEPQ